MGHGIQVISSEDESTVLGGDLKTEWYTFNQKLNNWFTSVYDAEAGCYIHRYKTSGYSFDNSTPNGDYNNGIDWPIIFIALGTTSAQGVCIYQSYLTSDGQVNIAIWTHNSVAPDLYAFDRGTPAQSLDTDGIRVWHSDGTLGFDSGWSDKLLSIQETVDITFSPGQVSTALSKTYTKPGTFFYTPYRKYHYQGPWDVDDYLWYWKGLFAFYNTSINKIQLDELTIQDSIIFAQSGLSVPDGVSTSLPIVECADYG